MNVPTSSGDTPTAAEVLHGRFVLETLLGRGAFASVWLAFDRQRKQRCALKVYSAETPRTPLLQYKEHIETLQRTLSPLNLPSVSLPYEVGQLNGLIFEAHPYLTDFRSLDQLLDSAGPLNPRDALVVLSNLARAAAILHDHGVIHADLKPANILVNHELKVNLIDFGMLQPLENEDAIVVFSTYSYMHPAIGGFESGSAKATTDAKITLRSNIIGSYIDVFAIGVIALELLTSKTTRPQPLLQFSIARVLRETNPWLRLAEATDVDAIAAILLQLLTVTSNAPRNILNNISEQCDSLLLRFSINAPKADISATEPASQIQRESTTVSKIRRGASEISLVGISLGKETGAFVLQAEKLQQIDDSVTSNKLLDEINGVFSTSLQRVRTSWKLGVMMTLVSFALLVGMIVSAVTLTVFTGKAQWAFVFGGVSVSMVVGTLIWRPYERLFRATILTQQIEMIHVQTIAGFRGSKNVAARQRACREAVAALRALMETAARGKE
jgi:serine/threonine protein kinase